jgi:hypothetical protein
MYSAIIERHFVFPRAIRVDFVGDQLKRNQVLAKKFVKRFLYS